MLNGGCLAIHGENYLGVFPDNYHYRDEWTAVCSFKYGGYSHTFNADLTLQWDSLLNPEGVKPDSEVNAWEDGPIPLLWVTNSFYDKESGNPHLEKFSPALDLIEKNWKNTYGDKVISFKRADTAAASLILPLDSPQLLVNPETLVVWRKVTFPSKSDSEFSGVKQSSLAKFLRRAKGDESISGAVVAFAYSEWGIDKFVHIRTNKSSGRTSLYIEMPRCKSDSTIGSTGSGNNETPGFTSDYEYDWDAYAPENCVLQGVSVYGSDIVSLALSHRNETEYLNYPDIYVPMRVLTISADTPLYYVPVDNAYDGRATSLFYDKEEGLISSYSEGLPKSAPKGESSPYVLKSSTRELNI